MTGFQAKGKAAGTKFTADDAIRFKNELQSSITSWDEIRNASKEKFGGMKYSFEEVLTGQAKDSDGNLDTELVSHVYDELEALGGIDIDDDGDIDDTDKSLLATARKNGDIFTGSKASDNGFMLIDALKKDKEKYRNVMANYLTETVVKDIYSIGVDSVKKKKTIIPKNITPKNPYGLPELMRMGPIPYQGGYAQEETRAQVTRWIDDLHSGEMIKYQGNEYTFVDDNWVENHGSEGSWVVGGPDEMRDKIFITDEPGFDNITTKPKEKKIDHDTCLLPSQNPFEEKNNEGQIAPLPEDFVEAVGYDENNVMEYLRQKKVKGLVMSRAVSNDGFYVGFEGEKTKAGNVKRKLFTADPNVTFDKTRAQEIWTWLHENWKSSDSGGVGSKYPVEDAE